MENVLAELNNEEPRTQLRQAEMEVARLKIEERQYEALVKVNATELEQEMASSTPDRQANAKWIAPMIGRKFQNSDR